MTGPPAECYVPQIRQMKVRRLRRGSAARAAPQPAGGWDRRSTVGTRSRDRLCARPGRGSEGTAWTGPCCWSLPPELRKGKDRGGGGHVAGGRDRAPAGRGHAHDAAGRPAGAAGDHQRQEGLRPRAVRAPARSCWRGGAPTAAWRWRWSTRTPRSSPPLGWPSAVTADPSADVVALDDGEIRERMSGNLCRCGAYASIVPAIWEVANR